VPNSHRPRLWLIAAGITFLSWVFLHLPASDAFERLLPYLGLAAYDRLWLAAAAVSGLGMIGYVCWREGWTPVSQAALLLLVLVGTSQALLLVAPIEYVHYPQYALLAYLLGRGGIAPEVAWAAATALGAIDEAHQLLVLRRGRPEYFDWNDIVLNAVGAAYGIVLLFCGRRVTSRVTWSSVQVAGTLAATVALALVLAPPTLTPYLTETPRRTYFRILSIPEGLVFVGLAWGVVRRMLRRRTATGDS
jgi:hypothetical protein